MKYSSQDGQIQFDYDDLGNINNLTVCGNHLVYWSNHTLVIDGKCITFTKEFPKNIFQKIYGKILALFNKMCVF